MISLLRQTRRRVQPQQQRQQDDASSSSFLTPVVLCILITETAERFAYFGFRAVLVLYFTYELKFPENTAIALFAYVTCLAYLSPLVGAILADGHLGRYRTILIFGCIYTVGLVILTSGAFIIVEDDNGNDDNTQQQQLFTKRLLTCIGLLMVCLGTGGIKPCVSAFGADQVAYDHQVGNNKEEVLLLDDDRKHGEIPFKEEQTTTRTTTTTATTTATTVQEETTTTTTAAADDRVRHFFASFYFCINVGAVTSIFVIPIVRARFGFGAAFLTPTVFIMLAMIAFLSKRNDYVHHVPETSLLTTFRLCTWILRKRMVNNIPFVHRYFPCIRPKQSPLSSSSSSSLSFADANDENGKTNTRSTLIAAATGHRIEGSSSSDGLIVVMDDDDHNKNDETIRNQQLSDATQALHVMPIMAMLPMFWMLYDQQGSVWTLQATKMSLHGIQPEQMNVVNPLLIMAFIPLFERIIYPALERDGWNITHLRRMGWGMLLAALSFLVSGFLETIIQSRELNGTPQVHVLWQLPQITILTIAEIFLSVTGLEFAYATSPDRLKAFLMALYLLTTAVGDFFGGLLYSSVFQDLNRSVVMYVCALLMLGNLGLFCCVARWWERSETSKNNNKGRLGLVGQRLSSGELFDYESLSRTTSFKGVELQRHQKVAVTS